MPERLSWGTERPRPRPIDTLLTVATLVLLAAGPALVIAAWRWAL